MWCGCNSLYIGDKMLKLIILIAVVAISFTYTVIECYSNHSKIVPYSITFVIGIASGVGFELFMSWLKKIKVRKLKGA
jgi:hypothetical protein